MNSWNNQNYSGAGVNNYGWPSPMSTQVNTNKIYVTSLEDALNRMASRGTEMVYFHQDSNEFYVVKTDFDGRKTWARFIYNVPNQDATIPATKADFNLLLERIEKLEKGEVTNAESNG